MPFADPVLEAFARAETRILIAAPFIKRGALRRLLAPARPAVRVDIVTRWRPEEVAAGVSDPEILWDVAARDGTVCLLDRLHAKLFRADAAILIGSANVTDSALGWRFPANLELLSPVDPTAPSVMAFEAIVAREAIPATNKLLEEVRQAADCLGGRPIDAQCDEDPLSPDEASLWLPRLREPRELFIAYKRGVHLMSSASRPAAAADLAALDISPGRDRATFEMLVGTRLRQSRAIALVDEVLSGPARFGLVRDHFVATFAITRDEATYSWQTLLRWLTYFLPEQYGRTVPRVSEVVTRRTP